MVRPSPELSRKLRNTREIIESGREHLLDDLVRNFPTDYVDIQTYRSIKRSMKYIYLGYHK